VIALATTGETEDLMTSFRYFCDSHPEFANITMTHINCSDSDFCTTHFLAPIPGLYGLRGSLSKYWRVTDQMDVNAWAKFIRSEFKPATLTPISDIQSQLQSGGSFFRLRTPNLSQTLLRTFQRVANYYQIFGCTFELLFVDISAPILTAFMGPRVTAEKRVRPIELDPFIDSAKFSIFHEFDFQEFLELAKGANIIAWLKTDNSSMNPFLDFEDSDSSYRFGVLNFYANPELRHRFQIAVNETATFIGFSYVFDCAVLTDTLPNESFYADLRTGQNCLPQRFLGGRYPRRTKSPSQAWITALFSFGVLMGISYFVFLKGRKPKKE
jgi:hypothetical protein